MDRYKNDSLALIFLEDDPNLNLIQMVFHQSIGKVFSTL